MRSGSAYRLSADTHSNTGSVVLSVADDTGRVVGTARLIAGAPWRLASLTFTDSAAAAALTHGVVQTLRVNRARSLAATVDGPARAFLASVGLLPTAGSIGELLDRQRRTNPEGFRLVTQGHGLDDIALPYPAELLTAPVAPALVG